MRVSTIRNAFPIIAGQSEGGNYFWRTTVSQKVETFHSRDTRQERSPEVVKDDACK